MLHNYVKVAWRNVVRHKYSALINVTGLWAGVLFTLLIGMYVRTERQVNQRLRHADRQCILLSHWKDASMGLDITTLAPLAKQLAITYPGLVRSYYRWDGLTSIVSRNNHHFRESIELGDSTLLTMYGFRLLYGDARTAMNEPFSVVLTAEKARKYFGRTDVVGETISIQNFAGGSHDFRITAVLDAIPENSVTQIKATLKDDFFIPNSAFTYFNRTSFESWQNTIIPSFIELRAGVEPADLAKPIQHLIEQHADEAVRKNVRVEPLRLTDYYRQKDNRLVERTLLTLSLTGLFILLMAVINFVNLTIGQSGSRIREIGLRKVLGSPRSRLVWQFLTESVLMSAVATGLAFGSYPLARPYFEQIVNKPLLPFTSLPAGFVIVPPLIVIATGLLAGFYPALVLSSLGMVEAVKGKLRTVTGKIGLRKVLVGFQFGVAALVMIAAVLVTQQVRYFFGQKLGYNREHVVTAQVPRDWSTAGVRRLLALRRAFAALPHVTHVSLSHEIPNGNLGGQPRVYQSGTDSARAVSSQALITDEQYLDTYQIRLSAGRFFNGSRTDSLSVVLNATAARAIGYPNPQAAVGQLLRATGDTRTFTIQGVTQDFQVGSMHQAIQPLVFFSVSNISVYRYLSFRLQPGPVQQPLEAIQSEWSALLPGSSFEYTFMDDTLRTLYGAELQLQRAAYLATALAALIALLGILGLVALAIQRQTKEIGIRRVLGATVADIVGLFVRDFIPVMSVAGIVAGALTYLLMQQWLNQYAYRIDLTFWSFFLPVCLLILTALILTGSQVFKAALTNPVKALRSE